MGPSRPLLADYLRPELILDLDEVGSAQELLETVAQRPTQRGLVPDAAEVAAVLARREQSGSTGFGEGVAIPHAIVDLPLARPVLTLVRVRSGID